MKFELVAKNIDITKELSKKLTNSLSKLKGALQSFSTIEKPGSIILEKRPRKEEYKAKVTFHLPKHTVSTKDVGFSPEQALHKAAEDARDQVLKVKGLLKDIHEKKRKAKIKQG